MLEVVRKRLVCYDLEPYYIPDKKGSLVQIGFQLSLYGTFQTGEEAASPDSEEYQKAEDDVRKLAVSLSRACNPDHMCETLTPDPATVIYAQERKMRPDVVVHIPVFDQNDFGHPVDEHVRDTLQAAIQLLESAGISKRKWHE